MWDNIWRQVQSISFPVHVADLAKEHRGRSQMLRNESERLVNDPEGRAEIRRVRDYRNGRNK